MSNPYQKYQQSSVASAAPGELTQMLYNGGVRFMHQGLKCIEEGRMQEAHQALVRAQEIYVYLGDTLNDDVTLSKHLRSLYDYIVRQVMNANIKKDAALLQEVLPFAIDLRNTWQEAMRHTGE